MKDLWPLSGQRRKVLFIGDEPAHRTLVSTFLSTMGWTCAVVPSREASPPPILERETFDAVLLDLGHFEASAEAVILQIKQIRPSLSERILAMSNGVANPQTNELIERYHLLQLPFDGLVQQVWSTMQELFISPSSLKPASRGPQVAKMIFDSTLAPLPAGTRSAHVCARQMAYQHKSATIDVSIDFLDKPGKVSLVGQVLDADRKEKTDGIPVLLVQSRGATARTVTNRFGEFSLAFECEEEVGLEVRLGERSWVSIPLGKMNWVKKRNPSR